jgi:hypothetical protein
VGDYYAEPARQADQGELVIGRRVIGAVGMGMDLACENLVALVALAVQLEYRLAVDLHQEAVGTQVTGLLWNERTFELNCFAVSRNGATERKEKLSTLGTLDAHRVQAALGELAGHLEASGCAKR